MNNKKLNIFLADDDDDDRDFFKSALAKLNYNYELTMLNNGQKVKKYFSSLPVPPDYVFLDINMPMADGIECLSYIKKLHPDHRFPIIMLSTANSEAVISRCYEAGATMYVRKPNTFSALVNILRVCIHGERISPVSEEFVVQLK